MGGVDHGIDISHLFFTDDNLIFFQPEVRMILKLRCVLLCFQAVSGLKINVNKSDMVKIVEIMLVELSGCKAMRLPIKYLSLSLDSKYKHVMMWEAMIERFERRLANWKRSFLSKGSRLTLIKSTLFIFLFTFYQFLLSLLRWPKKIGRHSIQVPVGE